MTGLQAAQTEFDQIVTSRLPYIIAAVIAVAFLLIMTAFPSLPLAVKAAALNLFSIAAAYGVAVAVSQFGWARTRNHHEAVAAGLASTARVITCAASEPS